MSRDLLAAALDQLRCGLLIVAPDGALVHGNAAALRVLARREGLAVRQGRVLAAHDGDRHAFAALLRAHAGPGRDADAPDVLALSRADAQPPLRVHATSLHPPAGGARPCVLLAWGDTDDADDGYLPPRAQRLRRAYGFTPAEARLAGCLLDGLALREAAQHLGLTYASARSQLNLLFGKTDTHRQAELIACLRTELDAPLRRRSG